MHSMRVELQCWPYLQLFIVMFLVAARGFHHQVEGCLGVRKGITHALKVLESQV